MITRQVGYKTYYDNPEEAIEKGHAPKSIGETFGEVYNGKQQKVLVVFQKGVTPYIAYPSAPGMKVRNATSKEIRSVRDWRNLQAR